uniref:family 1 glycosylhydrolase n=1 Tax=Mucilaginibacter sp. CSA2-8R TaxID=3141542 RepID=UPI00406C7A0C
MWYDQNNIEWLSVYGIRYGIVHVHFKSQNRIIKASANAYAQMISDQEKLA